MVNIVVLGGNLCAQPELKYTQSGTAVATLRLASNSSWRSSTGEKRERVLFIDVICWGKIAENCAEYLDKGSKVLVEGELRLNEWEDRRDGTKRSKIEVQASSVQFLSMKKSNGAAPAPAASHPVGAGSNTHDTNDANEDVPF